MVRAPARRRTKTGILGMQGTAYRALPSVGKVLFGRGKKSRPNP